MTTDTNRPVDLQTALDSSIADGLRSLVNRTLKKCPTLSEVENAFNGHHSKIEAIGVAAYSIELSHFCVEPADLVAFWLSGFCSGYDFGTQEGYLTGASGPEAWRELMGFRAAHNIQL